MGTGRDIKIAPGGSLVEEDSLRRVEYDVAIGET